MCYGRCEPDRLAVDAHRDATIRGQSPREESRFEPEQVATAALTSVLALPGTAEKRIFHNPRSSSHSFSVLPFRRHDLAKTLKDLHTIFT